MKELIHANQIAIKELGQQVELLKQRQERLIDMLQQLVDIKVKEVINGQC